MARPMTIQGKIRECVRVIRYWSQRMDEPYAAYNRAVFAKALKGHLAYVAEEGLWLSPDVLKQAQKVSVM